MIAEQARARPLRLAPLLLIAFLAGCTGGPPPPEPEPARVMMLALDGRWPFDPAAGAALLAEAGAPALLGALVMGEALANETLDVLALDEGAARALGVTPPARGEALASERSGIASGATLSLTSHSWPTPYVATYFEMERTPRCETRPSAKLCFLPELEEGTARLRLRVDEGARDAGFVPDLVELGPAGRPAYWNGSFEAPEGDRTPFTAYALVEGDIVLAEFPGAMAAGDWIVSFRLETNGRLAAAGAAGIVRVREPGYLWFDDRFQGIEEPAGQARAVIENATPTRAQVRVAGVVREVLPAGADIMLHVDDARELFGTRGATALLVQLTPAQERALDAARGPDGLTFALRPRAMPDAGKGDGGRGAEEGGALVFAGPADVDINALPRIEGAGAPQLALAGRSPIGEPTRLDGEPLSDDVLFLAHADGAVSWGLPPGGRWTRTEEALENLSRSRTLALGSEDLVPSAFATARAEIAGGNATRTVVAIGGVTGGPSRALWTSAALISGGVQPVAPRVVLPLEPGADRALVRAAAESAWAPYGLAYDR